MADRSIIMSGPMVRAILAGRKTQTRRVLRPQPVYRADVPTKLKWQLTNGRGIFNFDDEQFRRRAPILTPYAPGQRLWVRETWARVPATAYRASSDVEQRVDPTDRDFAAVYRAGWDRSAPRWRSPIHMPRWASRITLHVTERREIAR